MQRKDKNSSSGISEKLSSVRSEITYRKDKLDELIRDIADEVNILKQLLDKEEKLQRQDIVR